MILGIGTDLCNIDRIAGTLERFGDRFRNRVYTETEQLTRPMMASDLHLSNQRSSPICFSAL